MGCYFLRLDPRKWEVVLLVSNFCYVYLFKGYPLKHKNKQTHPEVWGWFRDWREDLDRIFLLVRCSRIACFLSFGLFWLPLVLIHVFLFSFGGGLLGFQCGLVSLGVGFGFGLALFGLVCLLLVLSLVVWFLLVFFPEEPEFYPCVQHFEASLGKR